MTSAIYLLAVETPPAKDFLDGVYPLVDLGLSGILVGVIIWFIRRRETLVSSGEWVPRRELDYVRADRDARILEKDAEIERQRLAIAEWRSAHETSERTREIQAGHIRDLVEALRSPERFFDAFRSHIEREFDDPS